MKMWWCQGKLHRIDGTAFIEYCKDDTVKKEEWYNNDQLYKHTLIIKNWIQLKRLQQWTS